MPRYCVGPTMAVDWGEDDAPVRVTRGLLGRVLGYFSPYRGRGVLVAACIAAESVLGLAPAVVIRALIDYLGHPHGNLGHVLLLVAVGVGTALGGGLIGVADSYVTTVISEGIVFTLRRQVFENLLDQSVGWFTRSHSGELMSRLSNDIDAVNDVVTDTVFGLARNLFTTIATLVLMLRFTWQLTLVVLVLIPLISLPARKAGRASYTARGRTQRKLAEMTAYLQEILGISGILLVKAFVRGRAERARFGQLNEQVRHAYDGAADRRARTDHGFRRLAGADRTHHRRHRVRVRHRSRRPAHRVAQLAGHHARERGGLPRGLPPPVRV